MKKIITGIIFCSLFALPAMAQNQNADNNRRNVSRESGNRKDRLSARMLEQLSLTSNQREQIKTINDDYRTKMQEMIKSDASADDKKTKRASLENDKNSRILALLTPDQITKLKQLQSENNEDHGDKGDYKEKVKTDDGKTKMKVKND